MTQVQAPTSNSYKAFGIAALVLGILAAVLSFVPCLGMYAIWPGALGLILAIIAFVQAGKAGAGKGMAIASLILCLVGSSIAIYQYTILSKAVTALKDGKLDSKMDSLSKALQAGLNAMDSTNNNATPKEAAVVDSSATH